MPKFSPILQLSIGLAIVMHVVLMSLLFWKPSTAMYRMQNQSMPIVHVTAISQTQIDDQINAIHKAEAEKKEKILAAKRAQAEKERRIALQKAQLKLAREKREKLEREKQEKAREEQKKALLAKAQKLQDQLMQQQMKSEQNTLKKMTSQMQQGAIDKYKAQILSLIQSNWRIHQLNADLSCVYDISVGPGGVVLSVQLVKSSGNEALDQSARAAILQSSPLPVPTDAALFDHFRHLILTLSPQGYAIS